MPLDMEVGLGDIVLDGDAALRERGTAVPPFTAHVCCGHGRPSQLLLSCCVFYDNMMCYWSWVADKQDSTSRFIFHFRKILLLLFIPSIIWFIVSSVKSM